MQPKLLPCFFFCLLSLTQSILPIVAAPLQFEGNTRACAGAVDNEVHRLSLTVRGFAPGETVRWSFEGVTFQDDKGRVLLPPRLWDGTQWKPTLSTNAHDNGTVTLRILSGQTAEKPRLVARVGDEMRGAVECDFDAPEQLRRFPLPNDDDYLPSPDYGWIFDRGFGLGRNQERGKIYLKFKRDANRGDVDGNWSVVNGHRLHISVADISFNSVMRHPNGKKAESFEGVQQTAAYLRLNNTQPPRENTTTITTNADGSAGFELIGGPGFALSRQELAGFSVEADDLSVYEPPRPVRSALKPVSPQGPALEWTQAASRLRGRLLVGAGKRKPQKTDWKVIHFNGNSRKEQAFSTGYWQARAYGEVDPHWSPDGSRFTLTAFGTMNDYTRAIGIYDAVNFKQLANIEPLYAHWKQFSPNSQYLASIFGSTHIVGSGPTGPEYTLRVWNGKDTVILPVKHTFLTRDEAQPMLCWNGSEELLVTQQDADWEKPQPRIVSVAVNGKTPPQPLLNMAWKPLSSPDGKLVAFFGPENKAQKPHQFFDHSPFNQSLCIARRDGKPMRQADTAYPDRLPLDRFDSTYPALFWSADSQWLYAATPYNERKRPFVEIVRYNVRTGNRQSVANWAYETPYNFAPHDNSNYQWQFRGQSPDGKTLSVVYHQWDDDPEDVFRVQTSQWFAIDLTTGQLEKLATIRGSDFAWHSNPH